MDQAGSAMNAGPEIALARTARALAIAHVASGIAARTFAIDSEMLAIDRVLISSDRIQGVICASSFDLH